jgi:hypothetical protein
MGLMVYLASFSVQATAANDGMGSANFDTPTKRFASLFFLRLSNLTNACHLEQRSC